MSVLLFLLVLFVLVLVHELGHFLIAKRAGIRVDEFGIGFPPKLFAKKIGETVYSFNLLPIGGFVKIFGENPDDESIAGPDKARSFVHKGKWVQVAVLSGGVLFNILFAWFLFSLGFMTGIPANPDEYNGTVRDLKIVVQEVLPESPAALAGLEVGDEIVAVLRDDAVSVQTVDAVSRFIAEGEEVLVVYQRSGLSGEANINPAVLSADSGPVIGVALSQVGLVTLPFFQALYEGGKVTVSALIAITVSLGIFFYQAFSLSADVSQIAGPVGIVGLVGDAQALGFAYLLSFTAFISLNLAVINILPFPALDGGRILFVFIEALKGSPIRPKVANTVNAIGFGLLMLLIIAVTYNDILRLF